ncbi:hypothetical protein B0H10DRAFT_1961163 [Mycena sp. CBHHK59/15]|nr:hypothetical protein B0H10DRAFT_1961163 [Mycena sp. CBHHK59/15]
MNCLRSLSVLCATSSCSASPSTLTNQTRHGGRRRPSSEHARPGRAREHRDEMVLEEDLEGYREGRGGEGDLVKARLNRETSTRSASRPLEQAILPSPVGLEAQDAEENIGPVAGGEREKGCKCELRRRPIFICCARAASSASLERGCRRVRGRSRYLLDSTLDIMQRNSR